MAEGGSFHLAAPGSIPGVSAQPTRLGVQGCSGVHSTLTAGMHCAKSYRPFELFANESCKL